MITSGPTVSRPAAFWLVAYAFAATMLGTTLPTPLYPIYQSAFHFSSLLVTVIFATYAAGVLIALVLLGRLSDLVGRRRALLPGLALSALSAVCFLLAHGLALMFAGRLLSGLSAGIFTGTATATLVDLAPDERQGSATLVATAANIGGLGLGPLVAGALAALVASPLRVPYAVDLVLVAGAVAAVWLSPETVEMRPGARLEIARLGVPAAVRGTFVRAAIAGFAGFAVLGLFTAVVPSFLGEVFHQHSHLLSGGLVFAIFAASLAGQLTLERMSLARALPTGCAALALGTALLGAGLTARSLGLIVAGTLVAGVGQGLSFRAGLAAINSETSATERAGVVSSFFVVSYTAISLPVVGVGVATSTFGLRPAGIAFTIIVTLLALGALASLVRRDRTA